MSSTKPSLKCPFHARVKSLIVWTRVHAIGATRSLLRRVLRGKKCVGHSLTQRKCSEKRCLNRGGAQLSTNCVTAPLSYQGPTMPVGPPTASPSVCHMAPLTGVRMNCVATCHVSAPCAPLAPRADHPGSATWPQCCVAPSRWSRAPCERLQLPLTTSAPAGKNPLFLRF